mmetsp:Transcript_8474/g.25491  ORF Transcript_8474/g.25491 Transcript_8474/m.25491 type:complete len:195 (-) Transcript_8474:37-621(-)
MMEWSFALQDRWLAYVRFGLSKHQASTITLETYAMGMSHWHKFLKDHHLYAPPKFNKVQSDLVFARAAQEHRDETRGEHEPHAWTANRITFQTFLRALEHAAHKIGTDPHDMEKLIIDARSEPSSSGTKALDIKWGRKENFTGAWAHQAPPKDPERSTRQWLKRNKSQKKGLLKTGSHPNTARPAPWGRISAVA